MKKLNENIKNDLERWDKVGYIIISASIGIYETDDNGEIVTDEDGYPYLSDQYLKSQDTIHGDKKSADNKVRTNELKKEIQNSGFSFKKVWGMYKGSSEDSFMIFPMKIKDGEVEEVDFKELYDFGKDLVNEYTQCSVHVHKPGTNNKFATNHKGDGEVEGYFKNVRPSKDDDLYTTRTVNPSKKNSVKHEFSSEWLDQSDKDFEEIYNLANN